MNIRIFTLACLFASALFPGMAGALDGTGSGTLEETILIKGCDNGLEYGDVTAFSIHTLGDWSLSTTEADYAGNYTLKKVKKKKKQGYAFNLALDAPSLDTLIDELGESVNQLCGRAPDTLAITQASVTKFIAKLSTDRTTLTLKLALAAKASDGTVTYSPKYNLLAQLAFTPTGGGIGGKIAGQVLAPDGQIAETHSISAGLDYPSVGPEHAWLRDQERAGYTYATDEEALAAVKVLSEMEGIIPALESAHGFVQAFKEAPGFDPHEAIIINMSGRGDKDIFTIAHSFDDPSWKRFIISRADEYRKSFGE